MPTPIRKSPIDAVDIHVGSRIKMLRVLRDKSQSDLAEALGLTFQQIQKYETGHNRISASKLWKLCEYLGVGASYFFEGLRPEPIPSMDWANDEVKVVADLRRMDTGLRASIIKMIDEASHPNRLPRAADGTVLKDPLAKLVRPFGRVSTKPNFLTIQEAGALYEHFRDVIWKGKYNFSNASWRQQSDGSWWRCHEDGTTLIVKPNGCEIDSTKELERRHG